MKSNCSNGGSSANDSVCIALSLQREITVADPTPIVDPALFTTVYTDESRLHINGTILVVNSGTTSASFNDGTIVVMLNNDPDTQYTVAPDDSLAKTFRDINDIKVTVTSSPVGQTGSYAANVQVSFSLNYKF